jgi:hypothetical protein
MPSDSKLPDITKVIDAYNKVVLIRRADGFNPNSDEYGVSVRQAKAYFDTFFAATCALKPGSEAREDAVMSVVDHHGRYIMYLHERTAQSLWFSAMKAAATPIDELLMSAPTSNEMLIAMSVKLWEAECPPTNKYKKYSFEGWGGGNNRRLHCGTIRGLVDARQESREKTKKWNEGVALVNNFIASNPRIFNPLYSTYTERFRSLEPSVYGVQNSSDLQRKRGEAYTEYLQDCERALENVLRDSSNENERAYARSYVGLWDWEKFPHQENRKDLWWAKLQEYPALEKRREEEQWREASERYHKSVAAASAAADHKASAPASAAALVGSAGGHPAVSPASAPTPSSAPTAAAVPAPVAPNAEAVRSAPAPELRH